VVDLWQLFPCDMVGGEEGCDLPLFHDAMIRNHHVFKDIKGQATLPGERTSPSPETSLEFSVKNPSPLCTTGAACGSGLGGI
jgi:hypothetical protein